MMWNNGWSVGGWVLMTLIIIAFWALVIGGSVWLLRNSRRRRPPELGDPVPR